MAKQCFSLALVYFYWITAVPPPRGAAGGYLNGSPQKPGVAAVSREIAAFLPGRPFHGGDSHGASSWRRGGRSGCAALSTG